MTAATSASPGGPSNETFILQCRRPRAGRPNRFRRPGHRPGQELRVEILPLGAGDAPPAQHPAGVVEVDRHGVKGHDQDLGLPGPAARQSARSLRHGREGHRRRRLCIDRLSGRPHARDICRADAVHDFKCRGRLEGLRRVVSSVCRQGHAERQTLLHVYPRRRDAALQEGDPHARPDQGYEDPAGTRHHGPVDERSRRHDRASVGAGIARSPRTRRRRRHHLPVGIAVRFQDRRHHQVPHRRADVCGDVRHHDQSRQIRRALGRPEEGHRRALHDRVGRQDGGRLGQVGR